MLSRSFVLANKRGRINAAMARACAEKGYHATTVSDVVRLARVSRATFYELYGGKEEVLVGLVEEALTEAEERTREAARAAGPEWEGQVAAAMARLLDLVGERPELARACLLDAPAAAAALSRLDASLDRFAHRLSRGPLAASDPRLAGWMLVAGVASILRRRLLPRTAADPATLLHDLCAFVLRAPSSPAAARQEI